MKKLGDFFSLAAGAAVLVTVAALTSFHVDAQVTSDRLLRAASEPRNWLTYSGSYMSQRYSPLDQITPANVKDLEQKWVLQTQVIGAWPVSYTHLTLPTNREV